MNSNWNLSEDDTDSAIHIAAYLMWRLNWIHPFRDGNGRTSRAISYLALRTRLGRTLAGSPTIADQIVDNKEPYYQALDAADAAWEQGVVDVKAMEVLISDLLVSNFHLWVKASPVGGCEGTIESALIGVEALVWLSP